MIIIALLTVLCFMCVFALCYHWFTSFSTARWSKFMFDFNQNISCRVDKDCPFTNQKCYNFQCMESKFDDCNPETGYWVKVDDHKIKCVCKYPNLVTQNVDGNNCSVQIGCGLYGRYVNKSLICECDKGFKRNAQGVCIAETEGDKSIKGPCPQGTIDSTSKRASLIYDKDYLAQFRGTRKCLIEPCSFNVLNGKKLAHTSLVPDNNIAPGSWRCLCSPLYGSFGVHLNAKHYLKTEGHNACASIYEDEPSEPSEINFMFYTYFYLPSTQAATWQLEPVTFLMFYNLPGEALVSQFFGKSSVVISDIFPHNFDQHILQVYKIGQRIRKCYDTLFSYNCMDYDNQYSYVPQCNSTTYSHNTYRYKQVAFANDVYSYNFVCRYHKDPYKNMIIVNPHAIDFKNSPDRYSHGYQLFYHKNKWYVEPGPAPVYDEFVFGNHAEALMGRKWYVTPKHHRQHTNAVLPGAIPFMSTPYF